MRNKIFGTIGLLWGGGIVINAVMTGEFSRSAYGLGRLGAVALGFLMFSAGAYVLFRKKT